jgi:lysophospholipase L1-like esterase
VAGDSIVHTITGTNGTAGYNRDSLWAFQLVNRLCELTDGEVRLINKGFGGSTSVQGAIRIDEGYYDVDYDLLIVSYGMNDASSLTTEAAYKQALRDFVIHRNRFRPNASVLILGPSSTNDAARSTIGDYRTWAAAVAAEYGAAHKVYYLDQSPAYGTSAGDLSTYYGESSGNRVHPNLAGHVALYNLIAPAVAATDFYSNVLGLSGAM